jgi:hypothetical protein
VFFQLAPVIAVSSPFFAEAASALQFVTGVIVKVERPSCITHSNVDAFLTIAFHVTMDITCWNHKDFVVMAGRPHLHQDSEVMCRERLVWSNFLNTNSALVGPQARTRIATRFFFQEA